MRPIVLLPISLCILFIGCKDENQSQTLLSMSMDSSITIIIETTGIMADSCLPACWPRYFTNKRPSISYVAYMWQTTLTGAKGNEIQLGHETRNRIANLAKIDSSHYPLIDYLYILKEQRINNKDVSKLKKLRVSTVLVNSLKPDLKDNELGYIHLSPIVTDRYGKKGVFLYSLQSEFYTSWLVIIEKKNNKWRQVSKLRLKTS